MMDEATIRLALRITARISALFFIGAFAGGASHVLWPSSPTRWLARNANRLIVALGASHSLHLMAVVGLASVLGQRFIQEITWVGIILGGLVYVLIYALVVRALVPAKQLGWLSSQRLQSVALYVVWFVFALAFIGGSFKSLWTHLPFALLALAGLVVRILGSRKLRGHSMSVGAG